MNMVDVDITGLTEIVKNKETQAEREPAFGCKGRGRAGRVNKLENLGQKSKT